MLFHGTDDFFQQWQIVFVMFRGQRLEQCCLITFNSNNSPPCCEPNLFELSRLCHLFCLLALSLSSGLFVLGKKSEAKLDAPLRSIWERFHLFSFSVAVFAVSQFFAASENNKMPPLQSLWHEESSTKIAMHTFAAPKVVEKPISFKTSKALPWNLLRLQATPTLLVLIYICHIWRSLHLAFYLNTYKRQLFIFH